MINKRTLAVEQILERGEIVSFLQAMKSNWEGTNWKQSTGLLKKHTLLPYWMILSIIIDKKLLQ